MILLGHDHDVANDSLSRCVEGALLGIISERGFSVIPVGNCEGEIHSKQGWFQVVVGLNVQMQGVPLADLVVEGLDKQPLEGRRVEVFVDAVLLLANRPLFEESDLWVLL